MEGKECQCSFRCDECQKRYFAEQADRINALRRYINVLEEENAKLRRNVMNAHLGAVCAS